MSQIYHKMKTDKLSMWNNMEDNIWLSIGLTLSIPQWSRQAVITVSRHDLVDYQKSNGVATDLFCTGVIGHPGSKVLKLGIEIPNLK